LPGGAEFKGAAVRLAGDEEEEDDDGLFKARGCELL
jgi:hypothetical protein